VKILILNGPNLNLLGIREPAIYGRTTLDEINAKLRERVTQEQVELYFVQSNHEGTLIDELQRARAEGFAGIIFNPGGLTFYSIALRDCLSGIDVPTVEVHLSNLHKRESFRHHSVLAAVCVAQVMGFGWRGYLVALDGLIGMLREQPGSKKE